MTSTTTESFFEAKYRDAADPWDFARSSYELARYSAILNALSPRRYNLAFEPGCSVGVLTEKLAAFCNHIEAFDLSETAVERAHIRCVYLPNIHIRHASLTEFLPHDADLYLFSEVGYYLTREALHKHLERAIEHLAPSATLLACHWLGHSPDHILSGDEVHDTIHQLPNLQHEHAERHTDFRLDRWTKRSNP
jgi:predicted TPR repeat methyltransferase